MKPTLRAGRMSLLLLGIVAGAGAVRAGVPSGAAPKLDAPAYRPDPASVQRWGPGYRYPQAGWIVLHVEGEPYERGYQHGRLLAPEIQKLIKALAAYRTPAAPADSWRELRIIVDALFLRKYSPEYLEEMKGIADGAAAAGATFNGRPVDLLDVATLNSDVETTFLDEACDVTPTGLEGRTFREPPEAAPRKPREGHCSAFAAIAPAAAEGVVFGHITMWNLYHAYNFNVWIDVAPARGNRVVMQTYAGGLMSGTDYYMNDKGLLLAETTIDQTRWNPEGKPLVDRVRRAVQYADSIDGAVAILGDSANGLYSNEWLLADVKTGEIAMFEQGTARTRLWRSSRDEWFGGTRGFYWGCNNAKDLDVRLEAVRSVEARPANVVFHPADRDRAWLKMFDRYKGRIDASFGFEAFTTPPLSANPTLDAKFTTTALAREMTSWAKFGPPLGLAKVPAPYERSRYGEIPALIPNDWAKLKVQDPETPEETATTKQPVDLGFGRPSREDDEPNDPAPAWRGTITPEADADVWLAAAFADYERIVALEARLRSKSGVAFPTVADQERIEAAFFVPSSTYLSAVARRGGKDLALSDVRADLRDDGWYDVASGKGVLILAAMRRMMGDAPFRAFMDDFGLAHAGKPASSAAFFSAAEKAYGSPLAETAKVWMGPDAVTKLHPAVSARRGTGRYWPIDAFEHEPESALIAYGTLAEADAQREAAGILQKKLARRWSNVYPPIKADVDVTDEELKANHVILVGRPATNALSARFASAVAPKFGPASFVVRGDLYAHPHTAVLAAGSNPFAADRSVVIVGGLSAEGTWKAVQAIPLSGGLSTEVVVYEAGGAARKLSVLPSDVDVRPPGVGGVAAAPGRRP